MKQVFNLVHSVARQGACAAIMAAPENYRVEIKPRTRSLDQNSKLHAMISFISKHLPWGGDYQTIETWKRLLTAAWLRARGEQIDLLPALDGHGVDVVFRHTSTLTIPEVSELIEFIYAWATEQNIDIPEQRIAHIRSIGMDS